MKISRQFNVTLILALLLAALMGPAQSNARAGFEQMPGSAVQMAALGTAFTYQGQLKLDGTPVEGNCDFQFKLWDAASSGSQVGVTLDVLNQSVAGGFFTASLDFGGSAFDGQARWLEVSVRCPAGSGSYTSLGLQPLTAAPYSLYSLASGLLDGQEGSFYQNASNLNAGTLNNARFSAQHDLADEGYLGNEAGDLAQNNGSRQNSLNADLLDGQHGNYYQRRVSGACAVGSAIRAINTDGTVECEQSAIFSRTPVDTVNEAGPDASITTGSDGLGLIGYFVNASNSLKVAHCTNATCSTSESYTVDNSGYVGWYPSITTGSDGFGLISYYDVTNGNLKVAHCTNAACSTSENYTVDNSANDVGRFTSITTGSDGFGLISYLDNTNLNLKVAHCTNAACSSPAIYTVVSAVDVSAFTSITIGGDGFGLISYYDATNHTLKVAHCATAVCNSVTIATPDSSANTVGHYNSITTGSDGFGLISYNDGTDGNLKVAHCDNAACSTASTTTLDSIDAVGAYTSITTGSDGFGLIAYLDETNYDIKVAHCKNTACSKASIYVLDSDGVLNGYTGITTGGDGFGLISYFNSANIDLLVAHCDDVVCKP